MAGLLIWRWEDEPPSNESAPGSAESAAEALQAPLQHSTAVAPASPVAHTAVEAPLLGAESSPSALLTLLRARLLPLRFSWSSVDPDLLTYMQQQPADRRHESYEDANQQSMPMWQPGLSLHNGASMPASLQNGQSNGHVPASEGEGVLWRRAPSASDHVTAAGPYPAGTKDGDRTGSAVLWRRSTPAAEHGNKQRQEPAEAVQKMSAPGTQASSPLQRQLTDFWAEPSHVVYADHRGAGLPSKSALLHRQSNDDYAASHLSQAELQLGEDVRTQQHGANWPRSESPAMSNGTSKLTRKRQPGAVQSGQRSTEQMRVFWDNCEP